MQQKKVPSISIENDSPDYYWVNELMTLFEIYGLYAAFYKQKSINILELMECYQHCTQKQPVQTILENIESIVNLNMQTKDCFESFGWDYFHETLEMYHFNTVIQQCKYLHIVRSHTDLTIAYKFSLHSPESHILGFRDYSQDFIAIFSHIQYIIQRIHQVTCILCKNV